jgi:hypothetical protein
VTPALHEFLTRQRKTLADLRKQVDWLSQPDNRLHSDNQDITADWRDVTVGHVAEMEALITKYDPEGLTAG